MNRLLPQSLLLGISLCLLAATPGTGAQSDAAAAADAAGAVDPAAVEALQRMSRYLMSLTTAEVTSRGSLDVVTGDGQRVQLDGVTNYKLRKPGFVIDYVSDNKKRRFLYDGKHFTVYAPTTGMYATVAAPATNREVLDTIYRQYGIALPLEDLFRWGDPANTRRGALKGAYQVGTATLDGVPTDHYAFREETVDWELWVQQGDRPLPQKLVIVDLTDPARPTFIARLDWKVNPALADADFTFVPDKDAKRIELATYKGSGE